MKSTPSQLGRAVRGALVIAVAVAGNVACSEAGGSGGGSVTLRVADSLPEGHTLSDEGIKYWMDRVTEESGGDIEFEHYPAGQLADADALLEATRDGLTDIGYVVPEYTSDLMPLSSVAGLPGYYDDSATGSEAFWEVLRDPLTDEEFVPNGVRPLFGVTMPPYQIVTADDAVDSSDDWSDLKIRSAGGSMDLTIEQLGASPVSVPGPEIYTAIQRGTVDGTLIPISSIPDYSLQEVVSHTTTNASLGGTGITFSINEEMWSSLSEEHQEIMQRVGEETVDHLSEALDAATKTATQDLDGQLTMTELPNTTIDEWNDEFAGVSERWVSEREDRDLPAAEVLETWEASIGG